MKKKKYETMIFASILFIIMGSMVFLSVSVQPNLDSIEGIVKDVKISAGGHCYPSLTTIYFEDGRVITFKIINYNFVIGEKYRITYEIIHSINQSLFLMKEIEVIA